MKGIIIYGSPEGAITFCDFINEASYELKNNYGSQEFISYLKGEASKASKAKCSPDDTYDFETGALIALMRLCGREKVIKACDELYRDDKFCGGRQNGKQFTLLVDLFKKLDQKKVDAAYKEAYNTTLPVWQKEVLKQMYEIRKIEASKYTIPHVHEWLYRIPTKREEMWDNIFVLHKESNVIIKVKKEDVNTFLHEIENKIPEITWASGVKIFETKYTIGDIYEELKTCDTIYFRLSKETKLSYSNDPHIYQYRELKHIDYLPPMRWDLFKNGRLAVKVNYVNCKEFYEACEKELGKKPSTCLWDKVTITISICKKDGNFEIFTIEHQKKTGRKIVDWEDVR